MTAEMKTSAHGRKVSKRLSTIKTSRSVKTIKLFEGRKPLNNFKAFTLQPKECLVFSVNIELSRIFDFACVQWRWQHLFTSKKLFYSNQRELKARRSMVNYRTMAEDESGKWWTSWSWSFKEKKMKTTRKSRSNCNEDKSSRVTSYS